jgi:hypothetical protein
VYRIDPAWLIPDPDLVEVLIHERCLKDWYGRDALPLECGV